MKFQKAIKEQLKARVALEGPTGSGKTWSALEWAQVLADGGDVAVIDTEHRSASYYADRFSFDTLHWPAPYEPHALTKILREAGPQYAVLIIDSFTHFWNGEGGTLDMVDAAAKRSGGGNSFAGWKTATPAFRTLVDTILAAPCHVICTMRSKMEYVLEEQRGRDGRTVKVPRKVGMAPEMRAGIEYEFTVVGELDMEHHLAITKSRCDLIADKVAQPHRASELAELFRGWLDTGAPPAPPEPAPSAPPEPHQPEPQPAAQAATEASQNGKDDTAQKAFFANLPGDLNQDDRHALYHLATGDPTIGFHGLDGRQRNKVTRWARLIESEELRLERLLTGPALFDAEGNVVHSVETQEAATAQ